MSTSNICFRREIRKILRGYPLLSVAMHLSTYQNIFTGQVILQFQNNGTTKGSWLIIKFNTDWPSRSQKELLTPLWYMLLLSVFSLLSHNLIIFSFQFL